MKKLAAAALAGVLATASVATTAETADASPLGWFLVGGVVGFGLATIIYHEHPFGTYGYTTLSYAGSDPHTSWCQQHYRSYVAATDTFTGYDGHTYRCAAPY